MVAERVAIAALQHQHVLFGRGAGVRVAAARVHADQGHHAAGLFGRWRRSGSRHRGSASCARGSRRGPSTQLYRVCHGNDAPEPQRESWSIQIDKDYLKFSAAHFLIFPDGTAERLHGHNYKVYATCTPTSTSTGWS
jgi:hypothetical protein